MTNTDRSKTCTISDIRRGVTSSFLGMLRIVDFSWLPRFRDNLRVHL